VATFPAYSLFSVSDAAFAAFASKELYSGDLMWEIEYESGLFALAAYASANGVQRK
jgi:hypothetical protein